MISWITYMQTSRITYMVRTTAPHSRTLATLSPVSSTLVAHNGLPIMLTVKGVGGLQAAQGDLDRHGSVFSFNVS